MANLIFMLDEVVEYCKVVQLYIDSAPCLIIGDDKRKHGEMLENVLSQQGVAFERMRAGSILVPVPNGKGYRLAGACYAHVYPRGFGLLRDIGSGSYPEFPANAEHAEKFNAVSPDKKLLIKE